jgi:hypothetical protein
MLKMTQEFQIADVVVGLIAVPVMHLFIRCERTTDVVSHD